MARVGALDGAAPDFGVGDFGAFPSRAEVLFSVFLAAPSDFAAAEDSDDDPEDDEPEDDSEDEPDEPDELDESDDAPEDESEDESDEDFEASARLSLR